MSDVVIVTPPETPVEPPTVVWRPMPPDRPRKVYSGMWGPIEIAVVAIGVMVLIGGFAAYFLFARPSEIELERSRVEADRLEAELVAAKSRYGEITTTQDRVGELVASVDDFETRFLPVIATGRRALYQRLNGLINAYGLTNTTGPDYSPLETREGERDQQSDEERGRSKLRSIYPGVYVTTTVEGSYQNIRRFLREIETGREFIVISSVELAPSDSGTPRQSGSETRTVSVPPTQVNPSLPPGFNATGSNNPPQAQVTQPAQPRPVQGKTTGAVVSLRLELASYFRRPNFVPMADLTRP
jgi:hypothetical protein